MNTDDLTDDQWQMLELLAEPNQFARVDGVIVLGVGRRRLGFARDFYHLRARRLATYAPQELKRVRLGARVIDVTDAGRQALATRAAQ